MVDKTTFKLAVRITLIATMPTIIALAATPTSRIHIIMDKADLSKLRITDPKDAKLKITFDHEKANKGKITIINKGTGKDIVANENSTTRSFTLTPGKWTATFKGINDMAIISFDDGASFYARPGAYRATKQKHID